MESKVKMLNKIADESQLDGPLLNDKNYTEQE